MWGGGGGEGRVLGVHYRGAGRVRNFFRYLQGSEINNP